MVVDDAPQTPGELASPPELLSPAGDRDCIAAAIENGADAVYFGLDCGFNARERAANFPLDEAAEALAALHRRGVKGYVTLNTLVFSGELARFEETVRAVAQAGADAVLVQDLGAARLIHQVCPELPIHASTQMTLTSAEGIALAEQLGIERVVLARELSLEEIRQIRRRTQMPLEVFVHGALCVAYSGQCLTSESFGGRSANRGQCAQACRLPYDLLCDGKDVDLAEKKYLLSPQDLAAWPLTAELIASGVSAFKIEGRLKSAEYVANITSHYRRAIDAAMANLPVQFSRQEIDEMELSFSRGFSPGWLNGCDHKMLVPADSSAKRGVLLGSVADISKNRVRVRLVRPLKRGDGVAFEGGRMEGTEQGGRVFEIWLAGRQVKDAPASAEAELSFGHGAIDFRHLRRGQKIWKTDDPELTRRWRRSFSGSRPVRRLPVDITVTAAVGKPLAAVARCPTGETVTIESPAPLEAAIQRPVTEEFLREQLGRLGGAGFSLRNLDAQIDGAPMVPLSVLGDVRRRLSAALEAALLAAPPRTIRRESVLPAMLAHATETPPAFTAQGSKHAAVEIRLLVRTLEQLKAGIDAGAVRLYADFADIRQYGQAVALAREAGRPLFLATPRIQKPSELGVFHSLWKQAPDGFLVRNLGGLAFFHQRQAQVTADFSFNAANPLTVRQLLSWGAGEVTASYDLNREQLLELTAAVRGQPLEVVVHQHMPMFHMEHCVFCAVLSPGTNSTNCGRPCDRHEVRLRDRIGYEHLLTADVGCRNTLFNATAQSGAEVVADLIAGGVRRLRIEVLDESPQQVREIFDLYSHLAAGQVSGDKVWRRLKATNRVGVTRGTLEERRNPLAIL